MYIFELTEHDKQVQEALISDLEVYGVTGRVTFVFL
jgi:hypothetical protein